ncbi:DUF222 domain-containing protein [Actinomycetes bacterium M1A6_2h]
MSASLLHAAVVDQHRGANAADAERIATYDAYYHARTAEPAGSVPTHASIVSELAAATRSTDGVVGGLLTLWWSMLPAVRTAFVAGDISLVTARVVKNHTADARTATLDRLENDIVCAAKALAPGPLGTEIDRLLAEADADWDARTRERAVLTETKVSITTMPRGLRKVVAIVPAVDAAAIGQTITAQTKRICNPDPATVNYLRAQAFVTVMRGGQLYCGCGRPTCVNPAPAEASAPFTAASDGTVTHNSAVCDTHRHPSSFGSIATSNCSSESVRPERNSTATDPSMPGHAAPSPRMRRGKPSFWRPAAISTPSPAVIPTTGTTGRSRIDHSSRRAAADAADRVALQPL